MPLPSVVKWTLGQHLITAMDIYMVEVRPVVGSLIGSVGAIYYLFSLFNYRTMPLSHT